MVIFRGNFNVHGGIGGAIIMLVTMETATVAVEFSSPSKLDHFITCEMTMDMHPNHYQRELAQLLSGTLLWRPKNGISAFRRTDGTLPSRVCHLPFKGSGTPVEITISAP